VLHPPGLNHTLGQAVHHSTGASNAISACTMSQADFFPEIVLPCLVPLAVLDALITSKAQAAHHRRSNVRFSDGFGSSRICDTIFKTRGGLARDAIADMRGQALG